MSATLAQQLRLATYKNALIKKRKRKESVWEMLRELRSAPCPSPIARGLPLTRSRVLQSRSTTWECSA